MKKAILLAIIFSFVFLLQNQQIRAAVIQPIISLLLLNGDNNGKSNRMVVGYLPSWAINWFDTNTAAQSQIATIPQVYTHALIAFAKPDLTFNGIDWTDTGILFSSSIAAIQAAIDELHSRNQKIFLAVGGATYDGWDGIAAEQGIAVSVTTHKKALYNLMIALDLDGLDVDYEADSNLIRYEKSILALREVVEAVGMDKELSLAGWSTGADCTADTTNDPWCSGQSLSWWGGNSGRELQVFRALINNGHAVEAVFDFVSVMAYDGGTSRFAPVTLWNNYRNIYAGPLNLGMELAPEGWDDAELVASNIQAAVCSTTSITQGDSYNETGTAYYSVEEFSTFIKTEQEDKAGVMLWALFDSKSEATCQHAVDFDGFTEAVEMYLFDAAD